MTASSQLSVNTFESALPTIPQAQRYDFEWVQLATENNPFVKFDYDSVDPAKPLRQLQLPTKLQVYKNTSHLGGVLLKRLCSAINVEPIKVTELISCPVVLADKRGKYIVSTDITMYQDRPSS